MKRNTNIKEHNAKEERISLQMYQQYQKHNTKEGRISFQIPNQEYHENIKLIRGIENHKEEIKVKK